jgi:uncharacterized membrane protein YhdT
MPVFRALHTPALLCQILSVLFCVCSRTLVFADTPARTPGFRIISVWSEIVVMLFRLFFIPVTLTPFQVAFLPIQCFGVFKLRSIRYFDQKLKNGSGDMFDEFQSASMLYPA